MQFQFRSTSVNRERLLLKLSIYDCQCPDIKRCIELNLKRLIIFDIFSFPLQFAEGSGGGGGEGSSSVLIFYFLAGL